KETVAVSSQCFDFSESSSLVYILSNNKNNFFENGSRILFFRQADIDFPASLTPKTNSGRNYQLLY
ncbi:MAG: hypothetical protein KA245_00955, partial [Phocaeicola sp.]|nr:hypothetical protein [Phocaeicola sp.]